MWSCLFIRKILHCIKSVQIRSFFWSVFSRIWTEYGPEKTQYVDTLHTVLREAGFHDYSEAFLAHFFPLFPFDPTENIRKSKVFWCFQGGSKRIEATTGSVHRKHTCVGVSFQKSCKSPGLQFYYKETIIQVLFCEYCEIFNNICFEKHLRMAASERKIGKKKNNWKCKNVPLK